MLCFAVNTITIEYKKILPNYLLEILTTWLFLVFFINLRYVSVNID